MGKGNISVRQWLKDKTRFADLFNGFVFDGKPVITLVLYYGLEVWDMNRDLYGMFRLNKNADEKALMEKYIPNYHINLIDAERLENLERFKTDLQVIFNMIKYRRKKDELMKYVGEHMEFFENVDRETYQVCQEFLSAKGVLKMTVSESEERVNMCKALEDLYADGVAEGEARGEARGETCGELNKTKIVVRNMLNRGMTEADICALAECTPELVEEVRKTL